MAVKPVDFRKGMVGLASLVQQELQRYPFSGIMFVFRCKRADRIKLLDMPRDYLDVGVMDWVACRPAPIVVGRTSTTTTSP